MAKQNKSSNIACLDFETDPFRRGRLPKPFIAGLWESFRFGEYSHYRSFHEEDFSEMDKSLEDLIKACSQFDGYIYAHNGGRFDFVFILRKALKMGIEIKSINMIKRRVAEFRINNATFRDSYLLLPVPLKQTELKEEFDYWKTEYSYKDLEDSELEQFEQDKQAEFDKDQNFLLSEEESLCPRLFYKDQCKKYLKADCKAVVDTISQFISLYGFGLTLAGRAFKSLADTNYHIAKRKDSSYSGGGFQIYDNCDAFFRQFFFGGRVQCFELGEIGFLDCEDLGNVPPLPLDLHYYDLNSAYPHAMTFPHWYGDCDQYWKPESLEDLTDLEFKCSFFIVECLSHGAFPVRKKDGGNEYPKRNGKFHVTGWELFQAIKLELVENVEVLEIFAPLQICSMKKFVKQVHARKQQAEKDENPTQRLIHKLVMNSGYGRFAIDPRDWKDNCLLPNGEIPKEDNGEPWELAIEIPELGIAFWERPSFAERRFFHSVATAASITGFVRAEIMLAVANAERPLYTDTDSLICVGKAKLNFGDELGQWKTEAEGTGVAIVAKKIYAFRQNDGEYKIASKGVKLEANEIIQAARGETVVWQNIAPSMSFSAYPSQESMEEMIKEEESKDFRKVFIERKISKGKIEMDEDDELLEILDENNSI